MVSSDIARDWVYIDDMVSAYLLVDKLNKYSSEVFNIGTGKQSTIKKVVELTSKITGETTNFRWGGMDDRKWDTTNWVADITKAKKLLGWRPEFDLKRGLLTTWEWFKKNLNCYD